MLDHSDELPAKGQDMDDWIKFLRDAQSQDTNLRDWDAAMDVIAARKSRRAKKT